ISQETSSPCGSLVAMMSQILTLHALRASRSARSSGVPSGSFASNASDAVSGELGGLPASSAKAAWLKQRERHATAAVRAKFMEPSPKGRWSMVSRMRHGDALDFWVLAICPLKPSGRQRGFCVSALQNQPPSNSNDSDRRFEAPKCDYYAPR